MHFINADYFTVELGEGIFDAVITDIPYKKSQKGRYHEEDFSFRAFFEKTFKECKKDAVLITFSNEKCMLDLRLFCESSGWKYHTMNVWFKPNIHNPTDSNVPLKNCEFILYFFKGGGYKMLNFLNGSKYKVESVRKSSLYTDRPCKNRFHYGHYQMTLQLSVLPPMKKYKAAKKQIKQRFPTFPSGWKRAKIMVNGKPKCFAPEKPLGFSWFFWNILMGEKFDAETEKRSPRRREIKVLDPFAGTGALLSAFPTGIGVDICREQLEAARGLNGVNGVQIDNPDYIPLNDFIPLDSSELEDENEIQTEDNQQEERPERGKKQPTLADFIK